MRVRVDDCPMAIAQDALDESRDCGVGQRRGSAVARLLEGRSVQMLELVPSRATVVEAA